MPGIFINYRRDDAPGVAGRLYDHLVRSFSQRDLFIDVDAIKPGLDFVEQLDDQVSRCDVMLALIGPRWLMSEDKHGQRRLDSERDYVRIEIASALNRGIPVIPVLIQGAAMPAEDELPDDLKSLRRRHALELRHTRFAADAEAIASALKASLPKRRTSWAWPLAAGICLAVALGVLGVWLFYPRSDTAPPASISSTVPPQSSPEPVPPAIPPQTPPAPAPPTAPPQSSASTGPATLILQAPGHTAGLWRTGADGWKWVENNVTFRFRTVSETDSELVINDSSRDIYHRLNLLTGETFWRIGTSGSWIPHYRIVSETFNAPMAQSLPLDGCLYYAKDCGAPAASAWCARQGLGKAANFTGYPIVPQTYVIGDGRVCTTGPAVNCGTFTSITCAVGG